MKGSIKEVMKLESENYYLEKKIELFKKRIEENNKELKRFLK
ncbi:MAG: hypothetical protein ABIJ00_11435 [Candidatus Eisenbacteria bacterium]